MEAALSSLTTSDLGYSIIFTTQQNTNLTFKTTIFLKMHIYYIFALHIYTQVHPHNGPISLPL